MNKTVREYLKIILLDIFCIGIVWAVFAIAGKVLIKNAGLSAAGKITAMVFLVLWFRLQRAARLSPVKITAVYMAVSWFFFMISYHSWHWFVYLALTAVPAFYIMFSDRRKSRDSAFFSGACVLFGMGVFCIYAVPFGERFGGDAGTENYRLLGFLSAGFGICRACALGTLSAMGRIIKLRFREISEYK